MMLHKDGGETGPRAPEASRPEGLHRTIRRLLNIVAAVAVLVGIVRPIYLIADAVGHGPYTRAFNRRCQRIADDDHLIGRPESATLAALGKPTQTWEYNDGMGNETHSFNYFPSYVPRGGFQVQCRRGIVIGLVQLVD